MKFDIEKDFHFEGIPDAKRSAIANLLRKRQALFGPVFIAVAVGGLLIWCILHFAEPILAEIRKLPGGGRMLALVVISIAIAFFGHLGNATPDQNERVTAKQNPDDQNFDETIKWPKELTSWSKTVKAIQNSDNPIEARHDFLGKVYGSNYPYLSDTDVGPLHHLFYGRTRSGKTAFGMLPIVAQRMMRDDVFILWIDMKGDEFVRNSLEILCQRCGYPFKYVSSLQSRASYLYNPFLQDFWLDTSPTERTEMTLGGLGLLRLDTNPDTAYFDAQCERALNNLFRLYPHIKSFRELMQIVTSKRFRIQIGMSKKDFENTGAVMAPLDRMTGPEQINAVPGTGHPDAVFRDMIQFRGDPSPGVYYFSLPVMLESHVSRTIARFAFQQFLSIRRKSGSRRIPILLCADEGQHAISETWLTAIEQAAELNVSIFLAQQSISDLQLGTFGAHEKIAGNAGAEFFFSAMDEAGRDHLIQTSGLTFTLLEGRSSSTSTESGGSNRKTIQESQSEVLTTRITSNDINFLNRNFDACIASINTLSGFARFRHPMMIQILPMTTKEEYDRRSNLPWPAQTESTILRPYQAPPEEPEQPQPAPLPPPPPAPVPAPQQAPRKRRVAPKSPAQEQMANKLRNLVFPEPNDDRS